MRVHETMDIRARNGGVIQRNYVLSYRVKRHCAIVTVKITVLPKRYFSPLNLGSTCCRFRERIQARVCRYFCTARSFFFFCIQILNDGDGRNILKDGVCSWNVLPFSACAATVSRKEEYRRGQRNRRFPYSRLGSRFAVRLRVLRL